MEDLDDFFFHKEQIEESKEWIKSYQEDLLNTKKILLIYGPSGLGKTVMAQLLLKKFGYEVLEYNSTDNKTQKKMSEFLKKALTYKNVIDMFHDGQRPVGILLDEIDAIIKVNDKSGFLDFIQMLKMNDKFHNKKVTKRSKKKQETVLIDDYIHLTNPIICTCTSIHDKKMQELLKFSNLITLHKPEDEELITFIQLWFEERGKKIVEEAVYEIISFSQKDIRQLILMLEELNILCQTESILLSDVEVYKKVYTLKEEDVQLVDAIKYLFTKEMSIRQTQLYFDIDCLLVPLMMYQNIFTYYKTNNDTKKNWSYVKNMYQHICMHDTIQTNIFENQEWDELYDVSSFYAASLPHATALQMNRKTSEPFEVRQTNLLNKISQNLQNRKILNQVGIYLQKLNIDYDQFYYISSILNNFLEEFKKSQGLSKEEEDDDDVQNNEEDLNEEYLNNEINKCEDIGKNEYMCRDEKNINNEDSDSENLKELSKTVLKGKKTSTKATTKKASSKKSKKDESNKTFEKENTNLDIDEDFEEINSNIDSKKESIPIISPSQKKQAVHSLTQFMNKFQLNIEALEEILKIEKLNAEEVKKRKKFTMKLKNTILPYLTQDF